jgi:plasmid stability protein
VPHPSLLFAEGGIPQALPSSPSRVPRLRAGALRSHQRTWAENDGEAHHSFSFFHIFQTEVGFDMCITCNYVHSMAQMIQVRNVPDALHRSLKARAAMAGMSLSDYLLGELREIAERPTLAEFRERLHKRKSLPVALDTSGLLREERTAR